MDSKAMLTSGHASSYLQLLSQAASGVCGPDSATVKHFLRIPLACIFVMDAFATRACTPSSTGACCVAHNAHALIWRRRQEAQCVWRLAPPARSAAVECDMSED